MNFDSFVLLSQKLVGCALIGLAGLITIILILRHVGKKSGKMDESALSYATKSKAHGIHFGLAGSKICFSPVSAEGHVMTNGGTGSGKTSAQLIPTLRSWTGSGVYLDISGDISKNVPYIENKVVFNPEDPETPPFNVFAALDAIDDEEEIYEQLEKIAFLLIPETIHQSDSGKYFEDGGRKIVTAALYAFYWIDYDFCEIALQVVRSSVDELAEDIKKTGNLRAWLLITSLAEENEKNVAGCKSVANAALNIFATNTRIRRCVRRGRERERQITARQAGSCNIFIWIKDAKLQVYAPLVRIIMSQVLDYFADRPEEETTPALVAIDEFASFGKLDIVAALRKFRKKHVRIWILTQSVNDIFMIYGLNETRSMLNNFSFKVCLNASDAETQRYFADLIGQEYAEHTSYTRGTYFFTRRESTVNTSGAWEYSIRPEELDRLGDDLILLYPGGWKKLRKAFYFK